MKVAISLPRLYKNHKFRGIGVYTDNLIKHLQERRDKDLLIFVVDDGNFPKDTDVIHYPYFEFFWQTLPFYKNKPVVVTIHDVIPLIFPEEFPKGIKGFIRLQMQKLSLRGAKAVITDSKNSKKDIIDYLGVSEDKIYPIYLSSSIANKKIPRNKLLSFRKKYQLPTQFILYVGDVNWNKNLISLIKVCEKNKLNLVIVGKQAADKDFDPEHPENKTLLRLQQIARENKKIQLLGFVSNEDLAAIYKLATVYCQPSYYEGFGLPVLEAMNLGCPVVCSNATSLKEVGGEAVVYFNPYNLQDMEKNIIKVIGDTKIREKLIKRGKVQADKFSWDKTATATLDIYKKVLKF